MVGKGLRAVEGCAVPWMIGTMQSAERPFPFLPWPKTNPASRHACRICSHGRSAVAGDVVVVDAAPGDDVAEDDVAGGEVDGAGNGVAGDGFAFLGEGAALIAGVAADLVGFLIAGAGAESAFAGCGVTAEASAALGALAVALSGALLAALSGTSLAAVGEDAGAATVGAALDGGVELAVPGVAADRLAAPAKWIAVAI